MRSVDATGSADKRDRSGSLGRFAAKTLTVTAGVTLALWILIGQVFDRIDDTIDRGTVQLQEVIQSTARIHGRSFWSRVEKELDRAADPSNDLPPDKKQKLLADIRILTDRWRPFVVQAVQVFAGQPATPPNKVQ